MFHIVLLCQDSGQPKVKSVKLYKIDIAFIPLSVDNELMKNVIGCLTRHKRWFLILGYTLRVIAFKFFWREIVAGTVYSCGVVECVYVFKYEPAGMIHIADNKSVEPFALYQRMK